MKALIMVDVQNDFCPGGALAVKDGDQVVAPLNLFSEFTRKHNWKIMLYASRDWHPAQTVHFAKYGGTWPEHCVQNTVGAEFHEKLDVRGAVVISKGMSNSDDGYSAFEGSCLIRREGLLSLLLRSGVKRIFVGGLATDYCVKATVLDSLRYGFGTYVLTDACRAVDPGDGDQALQEMKAAGAILTTTKEVCCGRS